ncbi:MAG TPA: PPOX class F420-dependent oxidoreductase [Sporichthyaceae bacterium]|nr:PPOX class F420-dependent oxidoreductase [Sporichthyaceae bacterium]
MTELAPQIVDAFLTGAHLGHITTLNPDGSPHSTVVWLGVEDGEVVCGHLSDGYRKLRNVARDPRVSITVELPTSSPGGFQHHLVIEGRARLTEGGGAELVQQLAHVYLGPDVVFPGPGAPDGFVLRTTVQRVRGVFPDQTANDST